jgi:predicted AlkP superfamily phosphohydrolase/phosphomutase
MNGIFVAWGRGIKRGTKLGVVDILDVAPTIAAMFGTDLPGAEGKVLHQIFSEGRQEHE